MSDKPASPARGRKKTAPPAQQPPQEEVVVRLPLADLYPFPDHPFQVRDDEEMRETIQSVKEYGVIVPAIVRPREEGGYEIVAGHRRKYACEQAGLDTMPVLIRNLDRDAATIIMVDSNLQRENILPSERAKAYKMKLEAIKRQGARNDLTSPKISAKLRSDDEIGQQMGVSGDTVRNYISLTNLVPELMQMVDEKKIALSPAYQIAALKPEEQQMLVTTIDYEQATPSLSQAQRMKKFSQAGRLNEDNMLAIMSEEKKPEKFSLTFDGDRIRKYFPKSYTPLQMENTIIKLLEAWQKKRQRRPACSRAAETFWLCSSVPQTVSSLRLKTVIIGKLLPVYGWRCCVRCARHAERKPGPSGTLPGSYDGCWLRNGAVLPIVGFMTLPTPRHPETLLHILYAAKRFFFSI